MYKLLFVFVMLVSLHAEDRIQILGTSAVYNTPKLTTDGNPVIFYQDQILSADLLTYDQEKGFLQGQGNVHIFKGNEYHIISDYFSYDTQTNTRYSKPYFAFDQVTQMWMSTADAHSANEDVLLGSGVLSGCDSTNPGWKIRFEKAKYNTEKKWVDLYNAKLEIKDIPVFYTPYFGYPTDKTRRSGLLVPTYGLSSNEGFYFQQPIYIAPQNWWDLELRPQIRTSRGEGLYTDFRFVDSPSSKGLLRLGYFKEQDSYVTFRNLANNRHYGYNFSYINTSPLQDWLGISRETQSGIYISSSWMNDVDYMNLQRKDLINNVISNQVYSRANGFYANNSDYIGLYFKYYQYLDLSTENQKKTIQTLPEVHYHHFMNTFWNNSLLTNVDFQSNNFYRPLGKSAVESTLNIPITFQKSLFDDYLAFSYQANMTGKYLSFSGESLPADSFEYQNGAYGELNHSMSLQSNLVKPYDSFLHVLTPSIGYSFGGTRYYDGYYKIQHDKQVNHASDQCIPGNGNPACDYYNLTNTKDTVSLALTNHIFDLKGKQRIVDRLSQNFYSDQTGSYYGELQNELEWEVAEGIRYYNQTSYNHDRNRVTKEQNTVRYSKDIYTFGINHYYTDSGKGYTSYLTTDGTYRYGPNLKFLGSLAYDYHNQALTQGNIGFLYTRRCFDFGVKLVQRRMPLLTSTDGSTYVNDTYLFLTVILKPIGGSEFHYQLTNN